MNVMGRSIGIDILVCLGLTLVKRIQFHLRHYGCPGFVTCMGIHFVGYTQKGDEDKDTAELQVLIEVILDEEAVAIDVVPLSTKSPSISNVKSFIREDLEDMYKLVKAKYESTRPVEDLDLVLWNDLKIMFEPHVEDEIGKLQQRYKVLCWKLFDSCGVHCLSLQSGMIYMLVEKGYPLTPPTIIYMLNNKL
ncbi:hypothetical protein Tco_1040798 [Tanacetum coccineum]|uniref:Uncharacterized protein n=1 Tax=Tanacetum coccineum TaxID=301880 RepID=A0ABQ5GFE4_9ASTR